MKAIFADTFYWVALTNADDMSHRDAVAFDKSLYLALASHRRGPLRKPVAMPERNAIHIFATLKPQQVERLPVRRILKQRDTLVPPRSHLDKRQVNHRTRRHSRLTECTLF